MTEAVVRIPALIAILATAAMATLDMSIANTALPTIARELHIDDVAAIWIVNVYQIMMVAALLPLAALGEIAGHRRVFLAGLVIFSAASLGCGLAGSLPSLVAARAVQGLGAAAISGVTPALIRFLYPPQRLGRGLGTYALVVASAFTVGPTAASAVLAIASWPWLFLVNVPVGILACLLSVTGLPATPRDPRRFDAIAALLCAGFFACLLFGLGGAAHGMATRIVVPAILIATGCGFALVRHEIALPAPILAVDLFRLPVFALSSATSICAFTVQGIAFVVLPFLLHRVLGYSQVEIGLLITPWPALVALTALVAAPLSDRHPPGLLAGGGLLALCFGMASLALMAPTTAPVGLVWRLALCGIGFGFFQSPNMRAIMSAAPPARSGGASGILATSRLTGQALGAAFVALCFARAPLDGAVRALWIGCAVALLGSLLSLLRLVISRGEVADGR